MVISILSNPSLCPYSSSLATLLVIGVVSFVLASSTRSIHSHLRHSCWQKLMLKEEGSRRQMIYISDFPKAPGCLCCCRMLKMDLNSDFMPVSSKTSRTAVCPKQNQRIPMLLLVRNDTFPSPSPSTPKTAPECGFHPRETSMWPLFWQALPLLLNLTKNFPEAGCFFFFWWIV